MLRLRYTEAHVAALRASALELGIPFEEYAPEFASFAPVKESVFARHRVTPRTPAIPIHTADEVREEIEVRGEKEEVVELTEVVITPTAELREITPANRLRKTKFDRRIQIASYLDILKQKYGGRLPYPEELRKSAEPLERAFYYFLDENRARGETPDMTRLPKYSAVNVQQAIQKYRTEHPDLSRGKLARIDGPTYKRLWRHKAQGALDVVPIATRERGPWAGNAWAHYVSDHWGETRGEVEDFSDAFYRALRRQVLPRGFVLPDGSVLEKPCRAIEQVPLKRKRTATLGRED